MESASLPVIVLMLIYWKKSNMGNEINPVTYRTWRINGSNKIEIINLLGLTNLLF